MSAGTARETSNQANSREQGRVLLVTDEPQCASSLDALGRAGFAVVGVASGAAAIVALRKSRPHVIIADTSLRGISAEELTRHIVREQESVPLILFGDEEADAARRHTTLTAGAFDYFQLPAELPLLLARTEQLVKLKQAMDKLRAEADRDYLTGLANRRRFRTALGQELERWRRYRVACSLLLVDIDFLKRVNDTHGHSAGDSCIRHVAHALTELSRDNDTAARLGGEEFALLLAGATEASALSAAERLREAVAAHEVENVGGITVSIGVASCPAHADSERTLYAASDAALYRAKGEGRNQTMLAP
ncbi:MAG TPA: GGDEF domain-containing response regulator, partial [Pyrinomonadaceae bacterium]|nr:GGDEF domain-containing response regulator [Pyrinomonadaceae bacterium]